MTFHNKQQTFLLSWCPATLHGTYWSCKWKRWNSDMVGSYKSVQ